MLLWAAFGAALLSIRPAHAATYTTDASYQFEGQTAANTGAGLAVNSTDSRLYVIKRSTTAGAILILDTVSGSKVGSITPPAPTTVYDIALSPSNATLFLARQTPDGDYEIAAAPASDGDHGAAEVTTAIGGISGRPTGIAIAQSGSDLVMGIVTNPDLLVYKSTSGGAWTLVKSVNVGSTSLVRDIAALDTGSGAAFYILRPSFSNVPNVTSYALDGSVRPVSFAAIPASFEGYTFESITAAPSIDGEPSLHLAAETWEDANTPHLSVFRYTATGAFTGEGFGYGLSSAEPLASLAPVNTDPIPVPGAIVANHYYLGGTIPTTFSGAPQIVRVLITQGAVSPGRILGTITQVDPGQPANDATVVVAGRSTPTATTADTGAYTLAPLSPNTYKVGAWKFGYAAASASVTLQSGEDKTGVNLNLPGPVPTFTIAPAFVPPVLDGWIFPAEYPTDPMPLTVLGTDQTDPAVQAVAYATHDDDYLYVAVVGAEPSPGLNSAQSTNAQMLTLDDTVQIYVDPPHRHDAQAETSQLYQFAVNIPASVDGVPYGTSYRFQRRIDAEGQPVGSLASSDWQSRVGYTGAGWIVEARIPLVVLSIGGVPTADSVWGLLVGRHRPSTHNDARATLYSTSPMQVDRLTFPNTWTDVKFGARVTTVAGDVNRNGTLDVTDAVYVLRMAGGLSFTGPNDMNGNSAYWQAILDVADVWPAGTGDNAITIMDAIRLVRAAAGKDTL